MSKLNRQQRRQAERLLKKFRFPFPELQDWLRSFLRENPECIAQVNEDGTVTTNLSGEVEVLDVTEFRELLDATKQAHENTITSEDTIDKFSEVLAQADDDTTVMTNLFSDEDEEISVSEFGKRLDAIKEEREKNESRNQTDTGETGDA